MKSVTVSSIALLLGCVSTVFGQGSVLVSGNPPLTEEMVQHRIWVLDTFLGVHLTSEQQQAVRQGMVKAWQGHDRKVMQYSLDDLKSYGNESGLKSMAATNLEGYVEDLRRHPEMPDDAALLAAFEAAHPEHRDVMHARGLGDLVGKWVTGDAMAPTRNPFTGAAQGVSFSEALVLNIFSDGRFENGWQHRACNHGPACCREYGSAAEGTITVQGSKLTLDAEKVLQISKDPCVPANNITNPMGAKQATFDWSIKRGAEGKTMLCLSGRPFQFVEKTEPVCYTKEK